MKSLKLFLIGFVVGCLLNVPTFAQEIYQVEVYGKGQVMILIPGLTCSGEIWEETVEQFQDDYEIHVFTLAGYAGTEPLTDAPYLEQFKQGIEDYIKVKSLTNVILMGHSIGGYLAMWMASEQNPNLEKAIFVDSLPFYALALNPLAKEGFNQEQADGYIAYLEGLSEEELIDFKRKNLQDMIADSLLLEKALQWSVTTDFKTEAYSMQEMLAQDLRQEIADIQVPTLVLGAYRENPNLPFYTKEAAQKVFENQYEALPNLTLKMNTESGHFIMYDQPDWFYTQVEDFLNQ